MELARVGQPAAPLTWLIGSSLSIVANKFYRLHDRLIIRGSTACVSEQCLSAVMVVNRVKSRLKAPTEFRLREIFSGELLSSTPIATRRNRLSARREGHRHIGASSKPSDVNDLQHSLLSLVTRYSPAAP